MTIALYKEARTTRRCVKGWPRTWRPWRGWHDAVTSLKRRCAGGSRMRGSATVPAQRTACTTGPTAAQEALVVALRRNQLLPLNDVWAVTREFRCPTV
jgi:hypothetical protein